MFFVDSRFWLAFLGYSTTSVVQLFISAIFFLCFFFLMCGPLHEYITVCPFSCWLIFCLLFGVSSVQLLSGVQLCNPLDTALQTSCPSPAPEGFAKLMNIQVSDAFNHLIFCCHFSSYLHAFSQHWGFSKESHLRISYKVL